MKIIKKVFYLIKTSTYLKLSSFYLWRIDNVKDKKSYGEKHFRYLVAARQFYDKARINLDRCKEI